MDMNCKSPVGVETYYLIFWMIYFIQYSFMTTMVVTLLNLQYVVILSFSVSEQHFLEYHASIYISCTYFEKLVLSYFEEEILVLRLSEIRSVIHQH